MQPSTATTANAANSQEQQLRAQLELLKNTDAPSSASPPENESRASEPRNDSSISPAPQGQPSNGYDPPSIASHDVADTFATKGSRDAHIHPDLRGAQAHHQQLLAQGYSQPPNANMLPIAPPSGHSPGSSGHAQLAPAPPPADVSMEGQDANDGRSRAKRELSQSKRAAQNRAAQRAFRQRKEGYIKKLEQQVRDFASMEQAFKTLQSENYALREYVISLQSRLLDSEGEFPSPPDNVNLTHSPNAAGQGQPNETSTVNIGRGTPLEAVAQAVAGLAAHEQLNERYQQQQALKQDHDIPAGAAAAVAAVEESRRTEDINRQLQPGEGGPADHASAV